MVNFKKILIVSLLLMTIFVVACNNSTIVRENNSSHACTKEYNPQCGVDGKTYNNSCLTGDVEIAHSGICNAKIQSACEKNNGTWLSDSNECEGLSKDMCDQLGGKFNECASACRNNPRAQMCTMQCVIVCKFN